MEVKEMMRHVDHTLLTQTNRFAMMLWNMEPRLCVFRQVMSDRQRNM